MYPIKLLNKRDKNQVIPSDWMVFDIDRSCKVFGNPFAMKDKNDDHERDCVVDQYETYIDEKIKTDARTMIKFMLYTEYVKQGKQLALRCWCHPKRCHGHVLINRIHKAAGLTMTTELMEAPTVAPEQKKPKQPKFMDQKYSDDEIDYKECRFVIHIGKDEKMGRTKDWHMVKEVLHLKNGETVPNIRYIPNYEKIAYVTSPRFRKSYNQKREYEFKDRLMEVRTTESDVYKDVARALGDWGMTKRPDLLKDSPHVYGLDIPATVSIKKGYYDVMAKENKKHTPFSIAYSDTETNMLNLDRPGVKKNIIMQSVFFEGKLITVILDSFLGTMRDPQTTLRELYEVHMPQQGKDRCKEWEIILVKESIDIVKTCLQFCHDRQPDFLTFWNLIFDLDKMIECVEDAGYNPNDIFCDPRLPAGMRDHYLRRAQASQMSASGRTMTKKPEEQWHSWLCPASFYMICQMATYRFIRKSGQSLKSYSLDSILGKECKGLAKLKIKEAEGLSKAEFHIFMQQYHPGEYCIYHAWDVLCMPTLNDVIKDLTYSLPGTTEYSDFINFKSEPKRYVHKFHFFASEKYGAVTGVSGKSLVQSYDSITIPGSGHIVALEPHMTIDTGLKIFKDFPGLRTNLYGHCGD